ncbi:hypothetical protein J2S43_003455 [Catenuloplanes nepalensis]|uniref:Uncharacterized protein n=1 Tax=Catenuloplanes nepalensis TaxID=587533 RepID=A0ABT9MUM9_9ACTN|nr:hypothetical protein [Catenuloplanes nepalensis]MDP9794943.1 hypothetical protein [Catenuloplanes nepalensis]
MSDINPEQYSEYTTQDGPGSADSDPMAAVPDPDGIGEDIDPRSGDHRKPEPDRAQGAH